MFRFTLSTLQRVQRRSLAHAAEITSIFHFNALHAVAWVVFSVTACGDTVTGHEEPAVDTVDTAAMIAPAAPDTAFEPNASAPDPMVSPSEPEAAPSAEVDTEETPPGTDAAAPPPSSATPAAPQTREEQSREVDVAAERSNSEWPADCEERRVLRAHAISRGGDTSSYALDPGEERVAHFFFKLDSREPMQLLRSVFQVDNAQVVHHWSLYALRTQQLHDGQVLTDANLLDVLRLLGNEFIVGGGPGAEPLEMPSGIGLRLPHGSDVGLLLEVHYFNPTDAVAEDRSSIEVCLTSNRRPIEAAVHALGHVNFRLPPHERTDIVATCVPSKPREPIHILAITPHMHARGTHAQVVLNRGSGERTTLVDQPFDWREQRTYHMADGEASEIVLQPGDSLTSTCVFQNASDSEIASGGSVDDEMCGMLTLAWPAGALQNDADLGRAFLFPEDADCLEDD